jgi:hypothetical protein
MPGVTFAGNVKNPGTPEMVRVIVGKSTTIKEGDVLVYTNVNTRTQLSNLPLVVRPLASGDTMNTSLGVAGVALFDITTDSAGKITQNTYPVTVSGNAVRSSAYPTVGQVHSDVTTGYPVIAIARWSPENRFKCKVASDDTLSEVNLNIDYGFTCSSASDGSTYTINTDDTTTAPFRLRSYTPTDATSIATAGGNWGFIEPLASFDAVILGTYSTS